MFTNEVDNEVIKSEMMKETGTKQRYTADRPLTTIPKWRLREAETNTDIKGKEIHLLRKARAHLLMA